MNCPKCKSENFGPFSHEGIEFDFCSDCHGIWCDKGELAEYVSTLKDLQSTEKGERVDIPCPKCNSDCLYEVPYSKEKKVLIDCCPGCGGIFFDAKEMGKVKTLAANIDVEGRLVRVLANMYDRGYIELKNDD